MSDSLLILLGIAFVLIGVRFLPKLVYEIAFFGAIFGLVEWWKYWGVAVLSLPNMPNGVYVFTAAFMATWIVIRLLFIAGLFIPQAKMLSVVLEGK